MRNIVVIDRKLVTEDIISQRELECNKTTSKDERERDKKKYKVIIKCMYSGLHSSSQRSSGLLPSDN